MAYSIGEDKPQLPVEGLLVAGHDRQQGIVADAAKAVGDHRQAKLLKQPLLAGDDRFIDSAEAAGQPSGRHHAEGNRLAVQQRAIACGRLERMGKGVPIVQAGPKPGLLAFVSLHDIGLELSRPLDDRRDGRRLTCHDGIGMRLKPGKELSIKNHAVLHDLGQAADELAIR